MQAGVDFIKVGHTAQIIEIALSSCALSQTFEKLFTGVNVWHWVRKIGAGRKIVYEIDPRSPNLTSIKRIISEISLFANIENLFTLPIEL